ncbi:MAG TPA: hypothetical protein VIX86_23405 [Streptosporangiaceae bacterium]
MRHRRAWVAAALAVPVLAVSGWLAASQLTGTGPSPAGLQVFRAQQAGRHGATRINEPAGAGPRVGGIAQLPASTRQSREGLHTAAPRHTSAAPHRQAPAPPQAVRLPVYQNPFRGVSGLLAERVDMGADFGGTGPVCAIGDAVITNATASNGGWPGGGWITYRLTDGPDAGLMIYVAEDVTPTVQAGQQVSSGTVIANMYNGGDGIETGWAMPDGTSAESQLAVAGGISGGGPFPTMIGLSFDHLLTSLGVPAGSGSTQPGSGQLPAGYPAI